MEEGCNNITCVECVRIISMFPLILHSPLLAFCASIPLFNPSYILPSRMETWGDEVWATTVSSLLHIYLMHHRLFFFFFLCSCISSASDWLLSRPTLMTRAVAVDLECLNIFVLTCNFVGIYYSTSVIGSEIWWIHCFFKLFFIYLFVARLSWLDFCTSEYECLN